MRLVGLYREKQYSPGRHESNDAWLLEGVADRLRRQGWAIDLFTIDEAMGVEPPGSTESAPAPVSDAALVFSMCQGPAALERLAAWEQAGVPIVNSPRAARNTYRDRLPDLMADADVRFPATRLIATAAPPSFVPGGGTGGVWFKRGDVHASVSADVQRIDSASRFASGCAEFARRGIAIAAVQPHIEGDEVKFYGLAGGDFFYWLYSGDPARYRFDPQALARLAARGAAAAGLDIFGGDVIVAPSGDLTLIDLNDWPSFAPCREPAADAIVDYLTRLVYAGWHPGLVSSAHKSAV